MKLQTMVIVASAALAGCASQKKDTHPLDGPHTRLDAQVTPDKFEQAKDPKLSAETWFAAGQMAESVGHYDQAIAEYQKALKIDPNHHNSLFHLGAAYTHIRKYDDAIAIWHRYVQVTNGSAQAYNDLALTFQAAHRLGEADAAFRTGISKEPMNKQCQMNYGIMLARQGKFDDAAAHMEKVCSAAEVNYELGALCEEQGRKDQAKTYYEKSIELDPKASAPQARLAALR